MTAAKPRAHAKRVKPGWSIGAIIDDQAVRTVFQPVVHLASGSIAGFEALSRGPAGTDFESPLALIDAAKRADRLGELDWLCRSQAMHIAAEARLQTPCPGWSTSNQPGSPWTARPICSPRRNGPAPIYGSSWK